MAVNAVQTTKTVADPIAAYESILPLWRRNRAVCSGERFVKEFDGVIDTTTFSNLLAPFSPSMSQQQFNFFKAEAELPGVVSQYVKMVIGGLLRKKPQLELPEDAPADAKDWILSSFGQDGASLASFLDKALLEELQTSRCWVHVDYPSIPNAEEYTQEELLTFKPYPVLWEAEAVVNWTMTRDSVTGEQKLTRVIMRTFEEDFSTNEFHAELIDTVFVHEIVGGFYQIRKYQLQGATPQVPVVNGKQIKQHDGKSPTFEFVKLNDNIQHNGERLTFIPAWPLNGSVEVIDPVITQLVDKEVSLYNKLSRRNHLLYGASTYTPVLSANISDAEFAAIVNAGLGSWIRLNTGDTATILETPTAALADMDRAIVSGFEEMARLGVRMMSPEVAQSGVALELRNAAQTAQLGTLNMKVSSQMSDIIAFMINWRYGTEYTAQDVKFSMSADFNPAPLGEEWLRLITEWYQAGLLPRTVWLQILKQNDIMPPEYNDKDGQVEITNDEIILTPAEQMNAMTAVQQQGAV